MNFGEKLQSLRKSKGMSQEELASRVGVSRQAVSKWEIGESTPEVGKIIALAELFGITTDELLKGVAPSGGTMASNAASADNQTSNGNAANNNTNGNAASPGTNARYDGCTNQVYQYPVVKTDIGGFINRIFEWFKRKGYIGGILLATSGIPLILLGLFIRFSVKIVSAPSPEWYKEPDFFTNSCSFFTGVSTVIICIGAALIVGGVILAIILKLKVKKEELT